ncbi:family 10 glycosylhydrolase [Galbibacter sp. BG1]|uniref:glycoside hydrolase family 10 protein n=1 Tax=Galbibacter sp. BG1 TaxID=1170699 RepID=UPI0015B8F507|nr:family 10 glycosylhydrolase [Galbibacter sp. BG1]QLE00302.1 family 10 glycosylhydrolase [Galbibacter sp. BG1]
MTYKNIRITLYLFFIVVLTSCKTTNNTPYYYHKDGIKTSNNKWDAKTPYNIEEFRAAWIATVANINWPSKPGLSNKEQKEEAIELLDFLASHNYNAAVFQVRPQSDALYESNLEPWSYYLTGEPGKAPVPFYDPLEFWVEEAHKRGIELHVWLNPYRAHHTQGKDISEQSIVKTKPELVVKLENGMYWLDPSLEGTKEHSLAVVKDIVSRYDIDGVHFDDYFYPYDSYNNGKDFPDEKSYTAYLKSGGKLSRNDWRRESVNDFIKRVYKVIKDEKPFVKFGLSPFGIWRPGYPESVVGYDQYDKLYADAKLWLNEGWIDYFSPQLYWTINKKGQSFPELLGWWQRENTPNRHLWPGIKIDHGGDARNIDEVINQIMITRGMLPNSKGTVHWSIGPLIKYDSLSNAILKEPYSFKTLVPPSPWLDNMPPEQPTINITLKDNTANIIWNHPNKNDVFRYVIYLKYEGKKWEHQIFNEDDISTSVPFKLENNVLLEKIGITAVDRTGNQSLFLVEDLSKI